jgi:hypothetical protein
LFWAGAVSYGANRARLGRERGLEDRASREADDGEGESGGSAPVDMSLSESALKEAAEDDEDEDEDEDFDEELVMDLNPALPDQPTPDEAEDLPDGDAGLSQQTPPEPVPRRVRGTGRGIGEGREGLSMAAALETETGPAEAAWDTCGAVPPLRVGPVSIRRKQARRRASRMCPERLRPRLRLD